MEHPIFFLNFILELFHLPVPHDYPDYGNFWDMQQLLAPHVTYTLLIMAILIALPLLTMNRKMDIVPGGGQNFWEVVVGGLENFMAEFMGKEGARMMFPMLATFALFILVSNLVGLVPGFFSPTANLNVTLGMTLIVFTTTHFLGVKFHGAGYIKHFVGPVPAIAFMMIPIEIISHLARVLSLSIRLFGNILAKEYLLTILFLLAGMYFAPLPIMVLGLLVSVVQAGVFLLLSTLYFAMAMEDAH